LANLVFGKAIALLDFAFELVAMARDNVEIVVRQAAPLLLDLPFDLLPVSFNAIPIHVPLSFDYDVTSTAKHRTGSAGIHRANSCFAMDANSEHDTAWPVARSQPVRQGGC
jgi:hypothetical protein